MTIKANTVIVDGVRYISINDLIYYLDSNALECENKKDVRAVEVLNQLADILGKVM